MKHVTRMALMVGIAAGALWAASDRGYTQAADPNAALQFPEPDRAIAFDTNQPMAIASRKRALDMVATDRLTIAGSHLPFPGIGHVARASVGYAYVPIQWGADL